MQRRYTLIFIVLISALFLSSCGYHVYGREQLPFTEVAIGKIENRTYEPKVQDKLYQALAEEFSKHGIQVRSSAQKTITATVKTFDMSVLSEKKDVAVEYRITIVADFMVQDAAGKPRPLKHISSPFMVTISTQSSALEDVLVIKDVAQSRAMRDIAMEVVGALIYP